MSLFALFFGLMSGCFLSVLVGIVGSKRRIGFGWAFLASLLLTPLVGLLLALISDPLPVGTDRGLGCIGTLFGVLGLLFLVAFLFLLLAGGMLVAIPTAIPSAPFTKRFGTLTGSTAGSFSVSSKFGTKSTTFLSKSAR